MPPGSPTSELVELTAELERQPFAPGTVAAIGAARAWVARLRDGRATALPHDTVAFGMGYVTADGHRALDWERFQSEKTWPRLYAEGPAPADKPRLHHATPVPHKQAVVTTRDGHMVVLMRGGVAVLRPFTLLQNLGPRTPREVMLRGAEDRAELRRRLQVLDRR